MARKIKDFAPDVVILSDHGAPGLALSQTYKDKMILVSHHNPARFAAHETMSKFSKSDARLANWLEQRVVDKVSAVICPSNYMLDWFKRSFRFSRTLEVIPNLLDENWLDSIAVNDIRPELGMQPDDTLVYMPSPGSPLKGSQHLLSIVDGLGSVASKQIGFYIPGEIPVHLQKELLSLPSGVNIYMPGQQPYEEHIALMKACSFGISPSLMENFSMALLEAVLSGLPMLAFDTGGNSDIIHSEMNGYLVDEGDLKTLIQKALAWMKGDGLKEKRTATREFSRSHLSSALSLQTYVDLIETL